METPLAISLARYEVPKYSDSAPHLVEILDHGTNKETPLEGTLDGEREVKKDRDKLTHDPLAAQQQQLPSNHGMEQSSTHTEPAQTPTAGLAIESPEIELGALIL
jgi:hypothetical protein